MLLSNAALSLLVFVMFVHNAVSGDSHKRLMSYDEPKILQFFFFFFWLSKNRMLLIIIVPEVLERYMFKVTEYLVLVYTQNQAIAVA